MPWTGAGRAEAATIPMPGHPGHDGGCDRFHPFGTRPDGTGGGPGGNRGDRHTRTTEPAVPHGHEDSRGCAWAESATGGEPVPLWPGPPLALITGGKGDLAQAAAWALRDQGWRVRTPGRQELDVTDPAAVDGYCAGLDRLDYLVNAAGAIRDLPFARLHPRELDELLDLNLTGAARVLRACWPALARARGMVVFIGSHAAGRGTAGQAAYAAAKAGLLGLMRSAAAEGGPQGIRANLVLPGFLETKMTAGINERRRAEIRARHLLGELNSVEAAARFLAFLPTLPATSGQVFALDSRI